MIIHKIIIIKNVDEYKTDMLVSSVNNIKNYEKKETGIVYVKVNDQLSRLVYQVSKIKYSVIGTYMMVNNKRRIRLYHILTGECPDLLKDYDYLSELIDCKYIISYRWGQTNIDDVKIQKRDIEKSVNFLFNDPEKLLIPNSIERWEVINSENIVQEMYLDDRQMEIYQLIMKKINSNHSDYSDSDNHSESENHKIIYDQTKTIAESLQNNVLMIENLNSLISMVNDINPDLDPILSISNTNKIMIIGNKNDVSGSKHGNEIVLTPTNFDLTIFNKSELIEILEYINAVITDNRFDYLQDTITKEIVNYDL